MSIYEKKHAKKTPDTLIFKINTRDYLSGFDSLFSVITGVNNSRNIDSKIYS